MSALFHIDPFEEQRLGLEKSPALVAFGRFSQGAIWNSANATAKPQYAARWRGATLMSPTDVAHSAVVALWVKEPLWAIFLLPRGQVGPQ
jgi:hypothetical protein